MYSNNKKSIREVLNVAYDKHVEFQRKKRNYNIVLEPKLPVYLFSVRENLFEFKTTQEIADEVGCSERTVRNYINRMVDGFYLYSNERLVVKERIGLRNFYKIERV